MKQKIFITLLFISFYACKQKYPLNLGHGLILDYNGNSYLVIVNNRYIQLIPPHIQKYNLNDNFIIIEQKPVMEIFGRVPHGGSVSLDVKKKYFEKSTYRHYWIINLKEKCEYDTLTFRYKGVYGPYYLNEFIEKKIELGVPYSLQFKEIEN